MLSAAPFAHVALVALFVREILHAQNGKVYAFRLLENPLDIWCFVVVSDIAAAGGTDGDMAVRGVSVFPT